MFSRLVCLVVAVVSFSVSVFAQDPLGFITQRKQLTFVGPRSGEGYFSPDGKHMIFQSERKGENPFYQIYRMNLENGDSEILSTGKGKTTCAWFHPSMKKALFSSTHMDPAFQSKAQQEFESRKAAVKQKYSWSYDEFYDIFEIDLKTKKLKALTKSKGYDAEASYSPDGRQIVFASNRLAYEQPLSEEDKKIFEKDASYMMDLYIMNSDGTGVRRLTEAKGYDGGPFFSADGTKITWRRFKPNGQAAEIMVKQLPNGEEVQVTRMNTMSWAPYFHPSGDYIIFTSNKLGYANFELFIVDTHGKREPVRVTEWEGFDGLPVFSPDGKKLSWTHHNEKGESQIYIADWNDQKAREALGLPAALPTELALKGGFAIEDAKAMVEYLASEQMGGRAPGSPEEIQYTKLLADTFQKMGLSPAGSAGFFQKFDFASGVKLGGKEKLSITVGGKALELKVNEDFTPVSFSATGSFDEGEIVFAGYGIHAPASEKQPKYDSFEGLDVKGKWVLVFRDIPENIPNPRRIFLNTFSRLHHKALVAREGGAKGLLIVNGPNSSSKKLLRLRFDGAQFAGTQLPVISISDRVAEEIVKTSGQSLKALQDRLDGGEIHQAAIKGARASATVDLQFEKATGINVLASIRVPGAKETLVIGAHGDHLGRGLQGNSLARDDEKEKPHYGADDNASGVAGVVQIAQELAKRKSELRRNVIFAIWSAEEIGLIGAQHFVKNMSKDLKGQKVVGYLNLDMIGRLKENLIIQGTASAKEWTSLFEPFAAKSPFGFNLLEDPYVPSDAMAFYMGGVPSIHFFTGSHTEYHTPRDIPALINYQGITQVARLGADVALALAGKGRSGKPMHLTYQKVESSKKTMEGRSFRVFIGTIPDYSQEGIKGVLISGTSKNSPAEKAGLQSGDVITEVGGTKIQNLYDYVYVLQALKPDQVVNVKVQRKGKVEDLNVRPVLKE